MVVKVKKELRGKVEQFLSEYPKYEEYGGFLFENRLGNISEFLPIPNIHESKKDTYRMPDNAKALAEKFGSCRKLKVVARWHNHPTPAVCSEQDCRSAEYNNSLYSVMISPSKSDNGYGRHREYVWYFYKGIAPDNVKFV